jgi:hypothetical protein
MGIFQVPQDLTRDKTYEDFSINSPKERAKNFGQYDHVRVYGKDYFNKLRAAGFAVNEVNYSSQLPDDLTDKYRLVKDEILPVCFKN